jgi:hypothetical protein
MPKTGFCALLWPASELRTAKPCCSACVSGPPALALPTAVETLPSVPPLAWYQKRPFQAFGRRISKPIAYDRPSTALVRGNICPVTRQCSGTGCPPTVKVPAATALAALNVVLAKARRDCKVAHEDSAAPVAGVSCGSGASTSSSLLPPQPASTATASIPVSRRSGEEPMVCLRFLGYDDFIL